jgi:hypothetical protein
MFGLGFEQKVKVTILMRSSANYTILFYEFNNIIHEIYYIVILFASLAALKNSFVSFFKIFFQPLRYGGNRAFYIGGEKDTIMMPPPERFSSNAAYAATLLHELAHSTGHSSQN